MHNCPRGVPLNCCARPLSRLKDRHRPPLFVFALRAHGPAPRAIQEALDRHPARWRAAFTHPVEGGGNRPVPVIWFIVVKRSVTRRFNARTKKCSRNVHTDKDLGLCWPVPLIEHGIAWRSYKLFRPLFRFYERNYNNLLKAICNI